MDAFVHLLMAIAITTLTLRGLATILGAEAVKGPLDRLLIACILSGVAAPLVGDFGATFVREHTSNVPERPTFGDSLEDLAHRPTVLVLGVLVTFGHIVLVVAIVALRRRVSQGRRGAQPTVRGRERAEREEES
jgi:hypothetical protein